MKRSSYKVFGSDLSIKKSEDTKDAPKAADGPTNDENVHESGRRSLKEEVRLNPLANPYSFVPTVR